MKTQTYKAITVSLVTFGRLLVSAALAEVASGHVVNGQYDWNCVGLNNLAALAISSK